MSKNLDLDNNSPPPQRYYYAAEKDVIVDNKEKINILNSLEVDNFRKSGVPSSDEIRRRALETLVLAEKSGEKHNNYTDYLTVSSTNKGQGVSYASINASDLRVENTINLDQTSGNKQQQKNSLSFEPNEITGRSTLCSKKYLRANQHKKTDYISVEEILTSSFDGNVRNLCNSLRELNNSCVDRGINCGSNRSSSIPKNSDMSRKTSLNSFYCGDNSFPITANDCGLSTENFIPAELMNSKLYRDELEWRNEFAEIPKETNSSLNGDENSFDENLSRMTNFFRQRSENLSNIIDSVQKKNNDEPISLTDTSKRSDSNFSKHLENNHVSTQQLDSENSISLLSMSAIENVLAKISDGDDFDPVKILKRAKKSSNDNKIKNKKLELADTRDILGNKENESTINLCSTITFTESLLESKDFKDLYETETSSRKGDLTNLEEKNTDISTMKTSRKRSSKNIDVLNVYNSPTKKDKINMVQTVSPLKNLLPENDAYSESSTQMYKKSLLVKSSTDPISNLSKNSNSTKSTKVKTLHNSNSMSSLGSSTSFENRYFDIDYRSNSSSPVSPGKLSLPSYALSSKHSNAFPMRTNSQCSSSSEFNHNNDEQLPIKFNKTQLTWGSTKLRTNSKNSVVIKNCSTKRLIIRLAATGPGFQILDDQDEILKLMPQECRKVSVVFSPTAFGAAVGILHFASPNDTKYNKSVKLMLYGYGGHAKIILKGALKGPVGGSFITLGEVRELSHPLVKYFTIHNDGPLDGFVAFILDSNGNGLDIPSLKNKVKIEPFKAIIPAGESIKFKITFEPSRSDFKRIIKKISPVMTVANLKILHGDEPTRQRIRKILSNLNDDERAELTTESLDSCWEHFVGEKRLDGLSRLKEKADVVEDLFSSFKMVDWLLTINHSNYNNDTLSSTNLIFSDSDETIMFQTIIESNSKKTNGNDGIDINCADSTLVENLSVKPNSLIIDPTSQNNNKANFKISNSYKDIQFFEIRSNYNRLFVITPNTGKLLPNESITIEVRMSHIAFSLEEEINIEVYMENEKIVLPVTILKPFLQHPF